MEAMNTTITIEEARNIIETEEAIETMEILEVYEIELDYTKVYTHDEILGYIYRHGGTFNMIYEVSKLTHDKNVSDKQIVCAMNVWIEYEGVTYECDHLWFDTFTMRDEVIRVSRVQTRRKGGVKGLVREVTDVRVKRYRGRDGETRYCVYKAPAADGPGNFKLETLSHQHKHSMNNMREQFKKLGLA